MFGIDENKFNLSSIIAMMLLFLRMYDFSIK